MKSFISHLIKSLGVFFSLVILDYILCHHVYYIPEIGMFVRFQYTTWDKDDSIKLLREVDGINKYKYLRFNYWGNSLFAVRFARLYRESVDWLAMLPPSEFGSAYIINKKTREISFGMFRLCSNPPIAYHEVRLAITDKKMLADSSVFSYVTPQRDFRVKEPLLIVNNVHWLISYDLYTYPWEGCKKAHLWHAFVHGPASPED